MSAANLFFLSSHEDIYGQGIEFKGGDQMDWPIVNANFDVIPSTTEETYKDFFKACRKLGHLFSVKISGIFVQEVEECFILTGGKNWLSISFEEKEILRLNAYTDTPYWEYTTLLEWPEIMDKNRVDDPEEQKKIIEWSSVSNWVDFLCQRIVETNPDEKILDMVTFIKENH
ncbi:MAG: hypothetical protein WCJ39_07700 [bacterium]